MLDPRTIRPNEKPPFPPYSYYKGVLSPIECAAIKQLAESKELANGTIGNGDNASYREDLSYRTVDTRSLMPNERLAGNDMAWLYERIRERVERINNDLYRFDLTGMLENIVYLRYRCAEEGRPAGHYDWHQDFGGGVSSLRKLSVIVQLSDPTQYEGCRLRLFNDSDYDPGLIEQGDMIVFPSWTPHCVTPITRGERHALVSWITGPQFR